MGKLTEYFGLLNSDNLEEDKILCSHLDCEKVWSDIIEGRRLLRKYKKATSEPQLF